MDTFTKDPAEVLDYTVDFALQLAEDGGDTISAHVVTPPAGITKMTDSHTTTAITAWLSAGTAGTNYPIVYRATTTAGRVYERTIQVKVRNR